MFTGTPHPGKMPGVVLVTARRGTGVCQYGAL